MVGLRSGANTQRPATAIGDISICRKTTQLDWTLKDSYKPIDFQKGTEFREAAAVEIVGGVYEFAVGAPVVEPEAELEVAVLAFEGLTISNEVAATR